MTEKEILTKLVAMFYNEGTAENPRLCWGYTEGTNIGRLNKDLEKELVKYHKGGSVYD